MPNENPNTIGAGAGAGAGSSGDGAETAVSVSPTRHSRLRTRTAQSNSKFSWSAIFAFFKRFNIFSGQKDETLFEELDVDTQAKTVKAPALTGLRGFFRGKMRILKNPQKMARLRPLLVGSLFDFIFEKIVIF